MKGITVARVLTVCIVALLVGTACFGQDKTSKPEYGGILRTINSTGPQMLSYNPMMGPGDAVAIMPGSERLMDCSLDRRKGTGMEPVLAEKVDEDAKNLKITWHIRKGVKFHDGSELDAEVVRWCFQQVIDGKALPYIKMLKGMKVTDKYTLVMDLNGYSNQLVPSWGYWPIITSKAAWDKASGGDLEKGKEWARTNFVGTGPFMLKEFKRDDHMTWVKNPNYWRKGRPYLDGVETRFIPDSVTASAMMQAKEADIWEAPPKDQQELMKKGLKRQSSWPAVGFSIWINTANTETKWKDKRLREAVEYALDKDAIAKALGFGFFRPLKTLPPEGEWGFDPTNNGRPYNPEKAKQLIKDAGYPNGVKVKLLVLMTPDHRDAATAIKQYLDAAGFQIDVDIADPGRFFGTIYWKKPSAEQDLMFWMTGRMPNYLASYFAWMSTEPYTDVSFLGHTPEQEKMDRQAEQLTNTKDKQEMTKKIMRYMMDNALVIPIYDAPGAVMQQPWVHSNRFEQGFIRWQTDEVWMEKH